MAQRLSHAALVVQRDTADESAAGSPPAGSPPGGGAQCAGPVISADTSGIGQTVDGGQGVDGAKADQSALAVQTLPVQRTPPDPGGQAGGGAATASVTVPQISWSDFADGDESQQFAAQSAWSFGFQGGFTVSEDQANMWAKPSAKNDPTDGPRLLRHEQYHFNLAGVMATKATTAQGSRPTNQADFNRLMAVTNRHTTRYDADTNHGLNASSQATWESNIDSGNLAFP